MKHLFKPEVFKYILSVLLLMLIMKVLWFTVEVIWLPSKGENYVNQKGGKALYYRVKLTPNEAAAPVEITKKLPVKKISGNIKEIKLLALYNAPDATVVTVSYKGKTKVLSRGEKINGFVLEGAGNNFAIFSKDAKTYKLYLVKGKSSGSVSMKGVLTKESVSQKAVSKGDITDAGDHKIIDRSLLEHYAKNMDDIYKNIGIGEMRNGKDLVGFRVTFVRKGSPFAKLGVRRDDIIKSINGQEINSYNAAFNVYKNIQNMDNITLVVQRGKEEMELEYEIN